MNDRVPVTIYKQGPKIPCYSRGGLHEHARELARQGRGGDDIVVHMNKEELDALRAQYGDPTINPKTGLPEYFGIKDLIAPIAAIAAPVLLQSAFPETFMGFSDLLGGSQSLAGGLGGAGVGALTSKILGGKAGTGAVLGGLSGAIAPNFGDISSYMKGLTAVPEAASAASPDAFGSGLRVMPAGSTDFGGALDAGSTGIEGARDLTTSDLSRLDRVVPGGYMNSEGLVNAAKEIPLPVSSTVDPAMTGIPSGEAPSKAAQLLEKWKTPLLIGGGLMALQGLQQSKAPKAATSGSMIVPYSNGPNSTPLPNVTFNRQRRSPANLATYGQRSKTPDESRFFDDSFVAAAEGGEIEGNGGPLSMMAAQHNGPGYVGSKEPGGDGRSDGVTAMLSNKEFVIDAESLALLGNGDPDAGAKKMEEFRKNIRKQKGKALAKGKFSPDAKKSPLSYMSGGG